MTDVIHLLPDSVANQIAAGEVIQRPASVVKELVENAIDAGARQIIVLITDAGRTCIQVIDDGQGMSETDARLSFERHATSKICKADDLYALHTMGFRGEALASIAAVAQVELRTRRAEEETGTRILLEGSQLIRQEPVSCPVGSNFAVRNLFFNVPVRRKFLKSNTTELTNIITEFERIVLVNPAIAFTLRANEGEIFNLPAVTGVRARILSVFGKKLNQQLLPVEVETSMVKISGFVGKPDAARKKTEQFFFVNGRYMRHPYFYKALTDAYEHLIVAGEQIPFFLYLEVPPADIDVNIHPTKTEIKFENEHAIWQILSAAIKETLSKFNAVPSLDFDTIDRPDIPVFGETPSLEMPKVHVNTGYNPFQKPYAANAPAHASAWEGLYRGLEKPDADISNDSELPLVHTEESSVATEATYKVATAEHVREHLQYKGHYLLTSVKSGLMLIDQHRAHVRILFDCYMEQIAGRKGVSQGLLFPEVLQLTAAEALVLPEILSGLVALGFDLNDLGGSSYAVQGIPAGLEGLRPVELLRDMIHAAMEKGKDFKEPLQHRLALTLAHAAAIPYGQVLGDEEISRLINRLFASSMPNYTPDGQLILITLKDEELDRHFRAK